jgi:transposase-like protein
LGLPIFNPKYYHMTDIAKFRGKPKPDRVLSSWHEKENVLKILLSNNYDYKLTSEQTGVPQNTLRTWRKRYINGVKDAIKEQVDKFESEVVVAAKTVELVKNDFVEDVILAKKLTLQQLVKLIPKEKNLSRVTEALKLLHEMSTEIDPLSENGKTVNNYINVIKEMYQIKDK